MKQKIIIATLTLCLITVGGLIVNAGQGHNRSNGHGGAYQDMSESEHDEHYRGGNQRMNNHEMMPAFLQLTDEQVEQVKSIRAEEMIVIEKLRDKMQGYREQMRELAGEEFFDESAIRLIAEDKAAAQVEMTVSRARMRNSIQAILTPEQRELAEENRSGMNRDGGRHHRGLAW